jgi:PAS domain-containing protein
MASIGGPTLLSAADFGIGRLFGHIRDAVIVGDARTGRIVLWNPAAEALFGGSARGSGPGVRG